MNNFTRSRIVNAEDNLLRAECYPERGKEARWKEMINRREHREYSVVSDTAVISTGCTLCLDIHTK